MNDLEKYALRRIAMEYEVQVRQLTIGQIEDFLAFENGLNADESLAKKEESNRESTIRKKEAKKELLKEITENKEKNIYAQIPSNSSKIEQILSTNDKNDPKSLETEFLSLWLRYPRKQGKRDALRHYTAARKKGIDFQTISDGLDRYCDYIKRNHITDNYIKQGSAWFCQWSWDDDYSGTYSRGRGQNLTDEEAERIAREVLYGSEDIN